MNAKTRLEKLEQRIEAVRAGSDRNDRRLARLEAALARVYERFASESEPERTPEDEAALAEYKAALARELKKKLGGK